MPFLQNAGQKVNFLFALVAVLYLVLLTVDFARYGVVAPSWITAAFAIALGGWVGCRRSEKPRAPRVFAVLAAVSAAVLRRRPGLSRVRRARKACVGISRHIVGVFRHDGDDGARKRVRGEGVCVHAVRRRRGAGVFQPGIRSIVRIGAVKKGTRCVFAVLAAVSAAAQIALCCAAVPADPVSAARANAVARKGYVFTQSGDAGARIFFAPVSGEFFTLAQ